MFSVGKDAFSRCFSGDSAQLEYILQDLHIGILYNMRYKHKIINELRNNEIYYKKNL